MFAGVVRKDGDDLAFPATFGHVPSLGRGERSEHGSWLWVRGIDLLAGAPVVAGEGHIHRNLLGASHATLSASPHDGTKRRNPRFNGRQKDISVFSRKRTRAIAVGITAIAVGGGAYGVVSASGGSAASSTANTTTVGSNPRSGPTAGGASNARSGPAVGGTSGTIGSVSNSSFTVSTSAGQKVTVREASSTKYKVGTRSGSASAIRTGEPVLVLGTTNGTTITATQVIVQPSGGGSATSSAVVPFQRGAPTTSKQVGQIPSNYSQGSGAIVSGTTANKATKAALAAYPGGIVNRVVKLSNGEYEVHYIGVNWPHHIFVNKDFKVIGAD
jgi:hypothetical protein